MKLEMGAVTALLYNNTNHLLGGVHILRLSIDKTTLA